ncbi:HIT family protein [Oceanobacillus indicireducens]|uniref:HIT family protein n=1 Tax=Oceanobacillus indicireducens TaxID=1004261 RepID=A0A917Y5I6_9BACI|nr:HIT domain-containing protein [Oceanobacillus indicireducens]GGN67316.1 HIT family protein [Oceanobacillus indicireducens]
MEKCIFCNPEIEPKQEVIFSNEHCHFLQLEQSKIKGGLLEGAGLIVPKKHRETVFELTKDEWEATYRLLQRVKKYLDEEHKPQGYNLGWNCGEVGGQHIFHAHFHVIPRYKDEPLAGKGIRHMFKSEENVRGSY